MKGLTPFLSPLSWIFLLSTVLAIVLFYNSEVNYPEHLQRLEHIKNINTEVQNLKENVLLLGSAQYAQLGKLEQSELEVQRLIPYIPTELVIGAEIANMLQRLRLETRQVKNGFSDYRHAVVFFPKEINRLQRHFANDSQIMRDVLNLRAQLQQLEIETKLTSSQQKNILKQIQIVTAHIQKLKTIDKQTVTLLLENSKVLMDYHKQLNEFEKNLSSLNLVHKSKLLLVAYNKRFRKQIYRAAWLKQWFSIVAFFLLILTGITLYRLTVRVKFLEKNSRVLQEIADQAPVMLWMSDDNGNLIFTNDYWEKTFRFYKHRNIYSTEYLGGVHSDDRLSLLSFYQQQIDNPNVSGVQFRVKNEDGKYIYLHESLVTRFSEHGEHLGFICSIVDITHQKKLEEDVKLSACVFEHSTEGICLTNAQNEILQVNKAFIELTGYSREEVIGKKPSIMQSTTQSPKLYRQIWKQVNDKGLWQGEVLGRKKNGKEFPQWLSIMSVENDLGELTHHIAVFRDLSEQKKAEKDIEFLANYDGITKLPNREAFNKMVNHAIDQARHNHNHIALLYLDLSRFKAVNDSLGHQAGNQLLVKVAEDLKSCIRDVDCVARLGGDEFAILLDGIDDTDIYRQCPAIAERIHQCLNNPYIIQGKKVFIGVNIGIAVFPSDGENIETLLKHADMAMYHAKTTQRNEFLFYSDKLNQIVQKRLQIESELREALAKDELTLHYQPQYNLATEEIEGFEALIRWFHPEMGFIPPDQFINIAEEAGIIIEIGDWVLEKACKQLVEWQQQTHKPLRMAVNVSLKQLEREDFVEHVRNVLQKMKLPAVMLEIEVTESMFLDEESISLKLLHQLKEIGVQISMDDFGTGYSNMAYLKKLPINRIKIDKCFVSDIPEDKDDIAIVCAIIDIARHFNIKVIAEGIETREQADYLISQNCDEGQGYYFSRPLPAKEIIKLLV